jgi:hypothetical protein
MKFISAVALGLIASTSFVAASSDTDGTVTVSRKCEGKSLEVTCDWKGKNRRALRTRGEAPEKRMVELPNHRQLGLELKDVECSATFGDFEDYFTELTFPDDFVVETREADGEDDFGVFTAGFTLKGKDGAPDISGELGVELVDTEEGAAYDDSEISADCPE